MDDINSMVFFCEDVREEIGSKQSYMGVIGPYLNISSFPFVFPKICVAGLVQAGIRDKVSVAIDLECIEGAIAFLPPPMAQEVERAGDDPEWNVNVVLSLVQFTVQEPCVLHARLKVDEQLSTCRLRIRGQA